MTAADFSVKSMTAIEKNLAVGLWSKTAITSDWEKAIPFSRFHGCEKTTAFGLPIMCNFATTSAVSASSFPFLHTFSRFARSRIASIGSRACSSTKLASQPTSSP